MCDDSSFRAYYGGMVWYIVYDDCTGINVNMIAYLYSSHDNSTCAYCNIISDDRYSWFLHSNSNAMIDGAIAAYLSCTIDDGRVAMDKGRNLRQYAGKGAWNWFLVTVIIASQLPVDKWYDYIAEATLAEAIMDRLVNSSNLIKLEGPSMLQRRKR